MIIDIPSRIKQYFGYRLNKENILSEIILEKNKLKIRILIDPTHNIGKYDTAHIADIILSLRYRL